MLTDACRSDVGGAAVVRGVAGIKGQRASSGRRGRRRRRWRGDREVAGGGLNR
jgi:hypothetical protein